jgi:hypothetical protein
MSTKQQRRSYRAYKKRRWQTYSPQKKFASIWVWSLFTILFGIPILGFIALLAYFTFWLAMWYVPVIAVLFLITIWAMEQ